MGLHGWASTTLPGIIDPLLHFQFHAFTETETESVQMYVASQLDGVSSTTYTMSPLSFSFGEPIAINMVRLTALMQRQTALGGPLLANIGYLHTATLSSIVVYDAQGQVLHTVSIRSASGTVYPAVPEPATAALLGLSICWLLWRARRR